MRPWCTGIEQLTNEETTPKNLRLWLDLSDHLSTDKREKNGCTAPSASTLICACRHRRPIAGLPGLRWTNPVADARRSNKAPEPCRWRDRVHNTGRFLRKQAEGAARTRSRFFRSDVWLLVLLSGVRQRSRGGRRRSKRTRFLVVLFWRQLNRVLRLLLSRYLISHVVQRAGVFVNRRERLADPVGGWRWPLNTVARGRCKRRRDRRSGGADRRRQAFDDLVLELGPQSLDLGHVSSNGVFGHESKRGS